MACNTATFAAIGLDSATQLDHWGPPATANDGAVITSTAYSEGRSVVWTTVDGGGHECPPFAMQALWLFFAAHPR